MVLNCVDPLSLPSFCFNIWFARGNKKGMTFESKVKAKLFKIWFYGWERADLLALVGVVYCILLLSNAVSCVRSGT